MKNPPPLPTVSDPAPRNSKRWLWLVLSALIVGIGLMALIGGSMWVVARVSSEAELSDQGTPSRRAERESTTVRAIKPSSTAQTRETLRPAFQQWLVARWKLPANPPTPELGVFRRQALAWELRGPGYPAKYEVSAAADLALASLSKNANIDPIPKWLLGRHCSDATERLTLISEASQALAAADADPVIGWQVAVSHAMEIERGEPTESEVAEFQALSARALDRLRALLKKEPDFFNNVPIHVASYVMVGDSCISPDFGTTWSFLEANHADFAASVKDSPTVPEWLRAWIQARHHIRAAWDARGSGWSNSVSEQGWRIFSEELSHAKAAVETAYRKEPLHPGPAASGIVIAMGASDSPLSEMRQWFDRSISAQIDYDPAYRNYREGLMPRWHGSNRALIEFGEGCLAAGRFDTFQPWQLLHTHRSLASEWDLPNHYFIELKKTAPFEKLTEGYATSKVREPWHPFDMTTAAAFWMACQRYDLANQALEMIGHRPDPRAMEVWGLKNPAELLQKTAAFTSPAGELLRQAENADNAFQAAEAAKLYSEALAAGGIPEDATDYLHGCIIRSGMESAFSKGETIPFLPGPDAH